MKNYFHFSLILSFYIIDGDCMSEKRTSRGIKYNKNIPTNTDISSSKIGVVDSVSRIQCISLCMQADNCFWSTFNSGTCELLSISKTDIDALPQIGNNGGLPTYQMIKGCSEQACRLSDWCKFIEDDGYCIKYYVNGLEYDSARAVCRRDGGELLRIDNPNKQATVERVLKTVFDVKVSVTIQGTRETFTKPWLFDDGTLMNYHNWKLREPSNGSVELYIYLNADSNWQWNDVGPDIKPFLCEICA